MSLNEPGSDALWGSADDDDDLFLCDIPDNVASHSAKKVSMINNKPKVRTSKSTSWIASSFDGFDDFGQSSQPVKPKATTSRKRGRDKQDKPSSASVVPLSTSGGKHQLGTEELWVDKYAPKTQDDLAVHKKKITEVEGWLKASLQKSRGGPMCLLTGPAGAGKTATVRVLARQLGLTLQEWSNPVSEPTNTWSDDFVPSRPDFVPVGGFQSVSQAGQFRDFLLRANRYPSLQLGGDQACGNKVILVEEVPHIFSREPTLFHDIIRKHCKSGVSALIFIVSDISSGDSGERTLLPKHLQAELGIVNISFNPIATTSMVKVMQRVASAEVLQNSYRFESPTKGTLEALSAASSGDIRGAINALQFVCLRGCTDVEAAVTQSQRAEQLTGRASKGGSKAKQSTRKRKVAKKGAKGDEDKEDHLAAIGGRDTSLFLFRALGKILYCKRGEPADFPDHVPMPPQCAGQDRDPLLCNPEDIVERCHLSGDYFTAYLHQNYMEFFKEVDDVVAASEYLSDADFLTADWVARNSLRDYASSVASRGLMFSNSARARASSGATSSLGWKPLHKPAWYDTMRKSRENSATAKVLFKELSFISPPQELITQVLPTLLKTCKSNLRPGQAGFLHDVCQFKDNRFNFRSAERLDEKDVDVSNVDEIEVSVSITNSPTEEVSKDIGHTDDDIEITEFD